MSYLARGKRSISLSPPFLSALQEIVFSLPLQSRVSASSSPVAAPPHQSPEARPGLPGYSPRGGRMLSGLCADTEPAAGCRPLDAAGEVFRRPTQGVTFL